MIKQFVQWFCGFIFLLNNRDYNFILMSNFVGYLQKYLNSSPNINEFIVILTRELKAIKKGNPKAGELFR